MRDAWSNEQRFEGVLARIHGPRPSLERLVLVSQFLSYAASESYVLELLPLLRSCAADPELSEADPEQLTEIAVQLLRAGQLVSDATDRADLTAAAGTVTSYAARQLARLTKTTDAPAPGPGDPFHDGPGIADSMPRGRRLAADLIPDLIVPVVRESGIDDLPIGRACRIRCGSLVQSDARADRIHVAGAWVGDDRSGDALPAPLVAVARSLASAMTTGPVPPGLVGVLEAGEPGAVYRGQSATLGMTILLAAAMASSSEAARVWQLVPDLAASGVVRADGRVAGVEPESIPAKVEAVFFSSARRFLVPSEQAALFHGSLQRLFERYPQHQLEVVPVASVLDVIKAPGILQPIDTPRRIRAIRFVRRHAAPIAVACVLALAGSAAAVIVSSEAGGPAARIRLDGDALQVLDRADRVLDRIPVTPATAQKIDWNVHSGFRPGMALLADADQDSLPELFWADDLRPAASMIYRKNLVTGRTDSRALQLDTPFTSDDQVGSLQFVPLDLLVRDFDADGRMDLAVSARHDRQYPHLVVLLDAVTLAYRVDAEGNPQRFVHAGHLFGMESVDSDGDGIEELYLAGTNNAFRTAVAMKLDPRSLFGRGPAEGHYVADLLEPSRGILAYRSFPLTDVGRFLDSHYNFARHLAYHAPSRSLVVQVSETQVSVPFGTAGRLVQPSVTYTLNLALETMGVATDDQFDEVADAMRKGAN